MAAGARRREAVGKGRRRATPRVPDEKAEVIGLASTSIVSDELLVTADGYVRLRDELELLTTERRRELAERLRLARDDGDLADNPQLLDTLEEQAALERRIATLDAHLALARIVDGASRDGTADVGVRVRVRYFDTGETAEYELVGAIEANPAEGRVSIDAPLGRALCGQKAGAIVEVEAPRGRTFLELLAVEPGAVARTAGASA
jgi:transcription elongation factor GreA